jgi:predicted hotdog family 3-hydroxylacyl-ACP dehydratase
MSWGDPVQTARNDAALRAALPTGFQKKLLWIYQGGDDGLEELSKQAKRFGFVGIGGIASRIRAQGSEVTLAYLRRVGQVLTSVGAQAHVFGSGSARILQALGQMSWVCSIDTSRWLLGYRTHTLLLLSGEQRRATELGVCLTSRECAANNIRILQHWLQEKKLSATRPLASSGRGARG